VSAIQELRSYVEQLRRRFRFGRGRAGHCDLAAVALVATILLTVIISRFCVSRDSLWVCAAALLLSLVLAVRLVWHCRCGNRATLVDAGGALVSAIRATAADIQ